jgi:hypothetical protein
MDDDLDEESQTSVLYCDPDDVVFAVEPIFAAPSSSVDDALQLAELAKQVHRDNSEHRSKAKESRRARRDNANNSNDNANNGADDKDDNEQHDRLRRSVTLLQGGAEVLQQLEVRTGIISAVLVVLVCSFVFVFLCAVFRMSGARIGPLSIRSAPRDSTSPTTTTRKPRLVPPIAIRGVPKSTSKRLLR